MSDSLSILLTAGIAGLGLALYALVATVHQRISDRRFDRRVVADRLRELASPSNVVTLRPAVTCGHWRCGSDLAPGVVHHHGRVTYFGRAA